MFPEDINTLSVLSLGALTLALTLWMFREKKWKATQPSTIPGMQPSSKEEGNLGDLAKAGSLHEFLTGLHAQFGPIASFWLGEVYTVSIASPDTFRQHNQAAMDRPGILYGLFEPMFGPASITYATGTDFFTRKKQCMRAFGHDRYGAFLEMFQKTADDMVKDWSRRDPTDHIPLGKETFAFAVRAALLAILGEQFHDRTLVDKFKVAYETAMCEFERRLVDPIPPQPGTERWDKLEEAINYMRGSVKQAVRHRQETSRQGTLLIDDLIEHAANDEILTSDSITFLVGGFHTTGNMLTWSLYYLATHEQVQQKVYDEIMSVLGDSGLVDVSNLDRFTYTRQVLDESLRCGVVAPWAAKSYNKDYMLVGHCIPKNTPVIYALGVVMQDGSVFPSPDKFDPDRFSEANSRARPPYAFCPFGFPGKRKCPAYNYSYFKGIVLIATVLRRFKIEMQGEQTVKRVFGFVTHPDVEIWIKISKR